MLEKPNRALVLAVGNACIHAIAQDNSEWEIHSSINAWRGQRIEEAPETLRYVKHAIIESGRRNPARIVISESILMRQESKAGLGSSAAVTVAVVKALNPGIDDGGAYRLAYRAHTRAQGGVGSGFDVAAASYGTSIIYERPSSPEATDYVIEPVGPPRGLYIRAYNIRGAYTRTHVSARRVMEAVRSSREARRVFEELADANNTVIALLAAGRIGEALELVGRINMLRRRLGELAGVPVEPRDLDPVRGKLEEDGFKTLLPGAGGYDMILVVGDRPVPERRLPGIEPLDLAIV